MANSAIIGTLRAILSLDSAEFETGASRATKSAKQTEQTMLALGKAIGAAFSLQQLGKLSSDVVKATGHIDDLAKKMGLTVEAVQELDYAAKQSGGSIDQVSQAIALMGNRLTEGDKGTVGALKMLGLSLTELREMAPDEAFTAIATAISEIPDPMHRSKVAMDLFGRSGATLLPVLTSNIAGLRQEARETGAVMGNDLVKAGDAVGDSWDAMKQRVEVLKAQALIPLLQVFVELPRPIQAVAGIASEFSGVLSGLGLVIMSAGGPVAAFTAVSGALSGFGAALLAILSGPLAPFIAGALALGAVALAVRDKIKLVQTAFEDLDESLEQIQKRSPFKKILGDAVPLITSADKALAEFNITNKENEKRIQAGIEKWERWNEQVAALGRTLTGADVDDEVKKIAAAVKQVGGESKIGVAQIKELGRQLLELERKGATLEPVLRRIADRERDAEFNAKVFSTTLLDLGKSAEIAKPKWVDLANAFTATYVETQAFQLELLNLKGTITELEPPPMDPWQRWYDAANILIDGISQSVSYGLVEMIGHWNRHTEILKGIWEGIKNTFLNILNQMLDSFINSFLKGLISGIGAARLGETLASSLLGAFGIGGGGGGLVGSGVNLVGGLISGGGGIVAPSLIGGGTAIGGAGGAGAGIIGGGSAAVGGGGAAVGGGGAAGAGTGIGLGTAATIGIWAGGIAAPFIIGSLINPGPKDTAFVSEEIARAAWLAYLGDESLLPADLRHFIPEDLPSFAMGTGGRFMDFGAGTMAMLHGREMITPEGATMDAGSYGGRMMTVVIEQEGRVAARHLLPFIEGEVRRLKLDFA